jgi:hypothetical protein
MKKLFTLIALVFAVCSMQAQFTRADYPMVGDSEFYTGLDTTGISEGPGGTGLTWDYSAATPTATNLTINYVDPATHPQGSNIPGATVVMNQSDGVYQFLNVTNDSVVNVGELSTTSTACDYPVKQGTLIKFPSNVGALVTDSVEGEYFDGFLTNVTRWGSVTTEVDASGTLITPTITWNNVTRVFSRYVFQDSSWTGAAVSDIFVFRYEWYAAGRRTPVFFTNTRLVSVNAGPFTEERRIWWADTTAVGVEEALSVRGLEVNPNPSEGQARISYELETTEQVNVSLFNLMGERVLVVYSGTQQSGAQKLDLDASSLSAGIYFVRLEAGNSVVNRKVVIH